MGRSMDGWIGRWMGRWVDGWMKDNSMGAVSEEIITVWKEL